MTFYNNNRVNRSRFVLTLKRVGGGGGGGLFFFFSEELHVTAYLVICNVYFPNKSVIFA